MADWAVLSIIITTTISSRIRDAIMAPIPWFLIVFKPNRAKENQMHPRALSWYFYVLRVHCSTTQTGAFFSSCLVIYIFLSLFFWLLLQKYKCVLGCKFHCPSDPIQGASLISNITRLVVFSFDIILHFLRWKIKATRDRQMLVALLSRNWNNYRRLAVNGAENNRSPTWII